MIKVLLILSILSSKVSFGQSALDKRQVNWDSIMELKSKESLGKTFPAFKSTVDGVFLSNESLRGKVVFINFWFEACAPCIAEMGAVNELYLKLKDKKNFEFISFTYEKPEKIKELKDKFHIEYKVASISERECYRLNQNKGFPTSIVLDANGTIKYLTSGGHTNKDKARDFIMTEVYAKVLQEL